MSELCDDCPHAGYPTDKTRCLPCPRRIQQPPPDDLVEAGATAVHTYCSRNMIMTYLDADEDCIGVARAVITAIAPALKAQGAAEERARIVAWLRRKITPNTSTCVYPEDYAVTNIGAAINASTRNSIADALEAQEHQPWAT